jgi:hypothetical protein
MQRRRLFAYQNVADRQPEAIRRHCGSSTFCSMPMQGRAREIGSHICKVILSIDGSELPCLSPFFAALQSDESELSSVLVCWFFYFNFSSGLRTSCSRFAFTRPEECRTRSSTSAAPQGGSFLNTGPIQHPLYHFQPAK